MTTNVYKYILWFYVCWNYKHLFIYLCPVYCNILYLWSSGRLTELWCTCRCPVETCRSPAWPARGSRRRPSAPHSPGAPWRTATGTGRWACRRKIAAIKMWKSRTIVAVFKRLDGDLWRRMSKGRAVPHLSRQTGEKSEQRKSWVSGWHFRFNRGIQELLCWLT